MNQGLEVRWARSSASTSGTTNSCVAVMEGGAPRSSPTRRAPAPRRRSSASPPRASGWSARSPSARPSPTRRTPSSRSSASSAASSTRPRWSRRAAPALQLVSTPNGDVQIQIQDKIYSPPEISAFVLQKLKAAPRTTSASRSTRRSSPSRLLQRPAAPGHQGRRASSPASRSCASSTSPPRPRSPTASRRQTGSSWRSTTWAAAPSTSRSSSSAEGLFQVRSTGGDTFLGGEDFDQRIIDWLIEDFLQRHRDRPAPGPHGPAAPQGSGREGQVRAVHRSSRPRSCCPSSPPTPRGPSTSTRCSRGRSTRS